MNPKQGDIVLIPIPFTNLSSQKQRPVIVVSNNDHNSSSPDMIVVAMTSNPTLGRYSFRLTSHDLAQGVLNRPGVVRVDKIYTLEQKLTRRIFGHVKDEILTRISDLLRQIANQSRMLGSLTPMLSVRNGNQAIAFYQMAFGATELYHMESPDGAVVSQLSVGGAEFWLSDESPEHANFSPESLGGSTARMILTVSDPDAVCVQAIAAGAQKIAAVAEGYGWRLGRVCDPFGHHWEIGYPLD